MTLIARRAPACNNPWPSLQLQPSEPVFFSRIASVIAPLRPALWQVPARRERAAAGWGAWTIPLKAQITQRATKSLSKKAGRCPKNASQIILSFPHYWPASARHSRGRAWAASAGRYEGATARKRRVIPDGCRTVGIVGVDHEREFSFKQDKKCAEPRGGP